MWLKDRGLTLNQEKTRISCIDDGFDFLSFTIRRYHVRDGTKTLTKPSRDALKKIRRRNAEQLRALRGASPAEVIATMNPIIRGQANYYRPGASKKAYQSLDNHLWQHLHKWARRRHPKKNRKWVVARYFGQFHPTRRNRWVYGDRDSGAYLHQYAWTKIVRHVPVAGRNSPDDPDLARYWADRRRKRDPPTAGRVRGTRPAYPTRTMPAMRGTAAVHRPPTRLPRPVGELVRGHQEGDDRPGHHRTR